MTGSMPRRSGGVIVFVVVTFAVTWTVWAPLVSSPPDAGGDVPWTFFLGSAGPACGAAAAAWWEGGRSGLVSWTRRAFSVRIGWRWWVAAAGMPVAYFAIGSVAAALVTGGWPDPAQFGVTAKLPSLAWPFVAAVWILTFGLGEEMGWRGWLLPALSRRMSVLWAAVVVGGIWIVWHLPAFFFNPTYTAMGAAVIGWMLALMCGSVLLAWITVEAGWSIVPVLIWHAGFDLLTAADQSAGVIASTISAVVMVQGVGAGWLLWHRSRRDRLAP